ncbi:MAG TPA: NAD(P)/FAD-dependent oxidoreductase [Mucilaginibacter sp.]|jgi:all-trans-retinol 13,14-reductase|nr:NAD(P)/FAD-dependent oxidoreductase [Mucilaginibacter sp.]
MENFDILIIGSGMGGLVCADILGKEGFKVCVVEKNKQIGGSLQTYARDKVIFDSGVHYLGGLAKGQNLYQIFKYLGIMDKLKLQLQDVDAFDKILIEGDDTEYALAQGYENFINKLLVHFPDEEKALRAYCDKMKEICSKFPLYNLRSTNDLNEKSDVLEIDAKTYINSITTNTKLQIVLAANNALYAGEADKTPLYVHALILNSYIESSWKCIDGGSQIAKLLAQNIKANGGKIIRNAEVKKIAEENGEATYVELRDGSRIHARYFISNMHPVQTLEMTDTPLIKNAYRNRLKSLENSVSAFTINIVFKKDSFKYIRHNYYCVREDDVWTAADHTEENWPLGYAIFCGASSKSEEYAEGLSILAYMRYEEVEAWKDTFNTTLNENDRGETYNEFKKRKAEILLDAVERKFPGLRSCIKSYYTATPLSYRDYIGNEDGSLYGIAKDYKHTLKTFISPRTKLPNLYLTGQNLNLHGILGASMSGIVTCCALLGNDNIIAKIRNA